MHELVASELAPHQFDEALLAIIHLRNGLQERFAVEHTGAHQGSARSTRLATVRPATATIGRKIVAARRPPMTASWRRVTSHSSSRRHPSAHRDPVAVAPEVGAREVAAGSRGEPAEGLAGEVDPVHPDEGDAVAEVGEQDLGPAGAEQSTATAIAAARGSCRRCWSAGIPSLATRPSSTRR